MIALMTQRGTAIALEPDFIESVEQYDPEAHGYHLFRGETPIEDVCVVRTSSGREHLIARSYKYVTGIIRRFYEAD